MKSWRKTREKGQARNSRQVPDLRARKYVTDQGTDLRDRIGEVKDALEGARGCGAIDCGEGHLDRRRRKATYGEV